ncbi:MAG: hypothetical protein KatS3mg033_1645 [Thermonema sp.]|jgi:hypothetical protein|uniref:DUF6702 family protein n=1 Tax=Thermonema TaxID=28194 RepID=UPI00068987F5|nr:MULTISPECIES: DUF6702 family protein [Thermonema]GIV39845.1 MAG: hypothetical protein KatS3mg033_1645 [Thermonema sp.]
MTALVSFICSFWLSFVSLSTRHDFHTSLADVRYNTKSKHFEVALRVFTDDLEADLSKFTGKKVRYPQQGKDRSPDAALTAYLKQHFYPVYKGKPLNDIHYLGKENIVDVTWIYFEIPAGSIRPDKLRWRYSLMFDLFDDQNNLLNIDYQGRKATLLFDRTHPELPVSWD